ncbi:MAG: methyltransferase family protein [Bythopirellula sp.]
MSASPTSRWVVLPPHVLLVAILLSLALDRWLPLVRLWGSPGGYVGAAIIACGFLVNIYCALQFRRHQTTIIPFRESSALLTEGLYRYTRNPIYVSMVVVLLGFAIAWGSLSPWIVPPLFAWIITKRFVRYEEAMLLDAFGEEYHDYCRRVRRWI